MWVLLYQLLFILLLPLFAPVYLVRVTRRRKYRLSTPARLGFWPEPVRKQVLGGDRPIWVHALSVGEVLSAVPLVLRLRTVFPNVPVVVSTTTETGQEIARKRLQGAVRGFFYLPLDVVPLCAHRVKQLRPRLFVLVETDLWPGLLSVLQAQGVPAAFVNVRISSRSVGRYRLVRPVLKRMLDTFGVMGAQSLLDAHRLASLGGVHSGISVTGNLKFDMEPVPVSPAHRRRLAAELGLDPEQHPIIVAGSTHEGEERILFRCLQRLRKSVPHVRLIVAPRDRERFSAVFHLAGAMGFTAGYRSAKATEPREVVILDTMGELGGMYSLATVAFVGGSLVPRGGHNLMEAAAHGTPVVFGPYTEDFSDMALQMERCGAGFRVSDEGELQRVLERLLRDEGARVEAGERGLAFVHRNRGAVDRTAHLLRALL